MKKFFRSSMLFILAPIGLAFFFVSWVLLGFRGRKGKTPRVCLQATPIKSLTYIRDALREASITCDVAVTELYHLVTNDDFDHVLSSNQSNSVVRTVIQNLIIFRFVSKCLHRYDVFILYFDGGVLKATGLAWFEPILLRLAGKKLVYMAYGSDAFVYDHISDIRTRHALMSSYAHMGNHAGAIQRRIRHFTGYADIVIGHLVHLVNLPRWDVLCLLPYPVNTREFKPNYPGLNGPVKIAHAPNHRGAKGTEFLIDAIEVLKSEGIDVELDLIEGVPNKQALERISNCDIFVDQLIFGYALAALEGFALGKIVVTQIDGPNYEVFRSHSALNQCPAISANCETILPRLRELIAGRKNWQKIGRESRKFAEEHHSYKACTALFTEIFVKLGYQMKSGSQ